MQFTDRLRGRSKNASAAQAGICRDAPQDAFRRARADRHPAALVVVFAYKMWYLVFRISQIVSEDAMSKTVFITGASRGIGRATALLFAQKGYRVGAGYHASETEAKELLFACSQIGAAVQLVRGDVADDAAVRRMADEVERALGPIDVLVNNAGVSCDALFCDTTPDRWERVFQVNVKGAYSASRCVLPGMIRRGGGVIINVSSVWGIYGGSCEVAYSASKAALIGLTKALAREAGPSGVRVNCVAPGVIDTDMNAKLTDDERAALIDQTPLSRIGTPEDVARAIFFLASPDAAFITGHVLGVDGGFVG